MIRKELKKLENEIRNNRRQLHKIPELGLNTIQTKEYLIQQLSKFGVDEIKQGYALQGMVVRIKGKDSSTMIGFRCEMDGLPIKDETNCAYQSNHEHQSHSCGHDGHMAMMLGLIHYLCLHKKTLKKDVICVFQPGEEAHGGAKLMIENGLLKDYPMQLLIGLHLLGNLEYGKITSKAGPFMARNGEVYIHIKGKSAHAGFPYLGKDAIFIGATLMNQMQSIIARNIDPLKQAVLSIGTIHGGEAINQIAAMLTLQGTIRCLDDATYELIKTRIQTLCKGIEHAYDCEIECRLLDLYHVVDNPTALNTMLKEVSKDAYVESKAMMICEDFSFYQEKIPALYYFIGTKDEHHQANLHEGNFNFKEEILLYGIETNLRILEKLKII
ncbi:MAG: amidohydrolase [Erysipelotrichaceae bacterium]